MLRIIESLPKGVNKVRGEACLPLDYTVRNKKFQGFTVDITDMPLKVAYFVSFLLGALSDRGRLIIMSFSLIDFLSGSLSIPA